MGLLDTIRSVLGLGATSDTEPQPDASSEHAVKTTSEQTDDEPTADGEGSAALTEEPTGDSAAEPSEATEATDHTETETPDAESGEATDPVPEEPDDGSPHVESINGIGPAYAKRLGEAGVESVAELSAADADTLAEETGISAKRISGWIDSAGDQ